MKGSRLIYMGAFAAIGIATLLSTLGPLVIRTTIDSVIGGKPMDIPTWFSPVIEAAGGKSALKQNLWYSGAILVLLTVLNGIFLYLKGKWSAVASESIARNIRERVYDHLQSLPYDYQVKARTGDLIQRCTSDVETIRSFLAVQFIEIGRAVLIVASVSAIMFSLDVRLSFVSMAVVPVIFCFAFVFFRKVRSIFLLADEAEGRLSTVLQENLTGVRVVRAFARQAHEIEKFDIKNVEFKDLVYRLMRLLAIYWSSSDLLCLLQIAAILIAGSYWASSGAITLGTLVVFTSYEGMLLWPVRQTGRILTDMGKTFVSAGRIMEILDEPAEAMEEDALKPVIRGGIEFDNVSFDYKDGSPILNNISFTVKRGQTVAIMGPTGSGKTSLVNLLLRLYDYKSGSIKIDGTELRSIDKRWLRRNIGIVAQEPFLFSKTIKENIGLTKAHIEDDEVYRAAVTASVHDVIMDFEKGYDTAVGERGVTLSGGQKQRVTIARTVINNYPVLIFDDSLSAVDTETDAAIRKALRERRRDITTFIISHRVTTLSEADLILVLDRGELVQSGTHDELIAQDGLYRRIWTIQNELENDLEKELEIGA
jgi:ATP-binding cassette subfamily B protein